MEPLETISRSIRMAMTALVLLGCIGCALRRSGGESAADEARKEKISKKEKAKIAGEELAFLLSMTWDEARVLTAKHLEMPPHVRLAADEFEVLKSNLDGSARRVRASGKVFIEMTLDEPARLMAQEAFISEHEVILRGKPVLLRGSSLVEGLDDTTVFYFLGSRLKVIGRHRVKEMREVIEKAILVGDSRNQQGGAGGFGSPGPPPPLPMRQGPWAGGPNPLLPPLSPESIPASVRQKMLDEAGLIDVAPLLVPLGGDARSPAPPEGFTGPPDPVPPDPAPAPDREP